MKTFEEQRAEQQLGWMLWMDLWGSLKDECEAPSADLHLKPSSTLTFSRPSRTEARVLFRCSSGDYGLRVTIDPDLLYIRYKMDDDPFTRELLITVRGDSACFETRDHLSRTAEEVVHSMLISLVYFKE